MSIGYRLTTNPGLESLLSREAVEKSGHLRPVTEERPAGFAGHVRVSFDRPSRRTPCSELFTLRSAYHVIHDLGGWELTKDRLIDELCERVRELEIPGLENGTTFRVSCVRIGTHEFQSPDVERAVGSVIDERPDVSVDLANFDTEVRVDISDSLCMVGLQLTRESLDRRHQWVWRPRVSLRPAVAYAMLRLVEERHKERGEAENGSPQHALAGGVTRRTSWKVLDPFCGSGTVLMEAADIWPGAQLFGMDKREEAVAGCCSNLEILRSSGFPEKADRITVKQGDARDLKELWPAASFDAIVTNPPFGVRLHGAADLVRLYERFFSGATHVVKPGGTIVCLAARKRDKILRLVEDSSQLKMLGCHIIEVGGVFPGILVIERVGT